MKYSIEVLENQLVSLEQKRVKWVKVGGQDVIDQLDDKINQIKRSIEVLKANEVLP